MQEIVVSVVIPTYKRADRLVKAIDSAIDQTYDKLEVIVIDDNNPDSEYRKTTERIMSVNSRNDKVHYIKHERNKNGAAARNTGIKNAKGEYIAFLDDDDLFYHTKIEKQVNFLKRYDQYDAVYCGRVQNGKNIYGLLEGDLSEHILLETFSPTTPTLMFRKKALEEIGGFDESFCRHQDYELLLKFFKEHKIGVISEPLVEIGINNGENELHGKKLVENKKKYLQIFDADIRRIDQKKPGFRKKVFATNYRFIFFDHLSQKHIKDALNIYMLGCKTSFVFFHKSIFEYAVTYTKLWLKRKLCKFRICQ